MKSKNIFLISYDISSDKRRNKVAKLLQQYGYERIQYSVFTGLIAPHRNKPLWESLKKVIMESKDESKVICLAISQVAFANMKLIGILSADTKYLSGQKHTEVI